MFTLLKLKMRGQMSKHKSEDYKISGINYYFDNDVSMDYVCNNF